MTGSDKVVVVSALLVEGTKLNQSVAHHVGVGCKSSLNLLHCVARYLVPILVMAVDNLKLASEAVSHGGSHLEVFLACTVPFFLLFGTNLYIEAVGVQSTLCQLVYHNRTVNST